MNLTEAKTEVLRMVARPDKGVETVAAINKTISLLTLKGEFPQDIVESTLNINATLSAATIALTSLVRFRRFVYIKPTGTRYYLTKIGSDQVFTPGSRMQLNRYYLAGTNLTYTLSALNSSLEIAYYQAAPVLTEVTGNDTHWMLTTIPYAVVELAAAKLYRQIGDDASANQYEASGMQLFNTYVADSRQP